MLTIIQQNESLIQQVIQLISDIPATLYSRCCTEVFSSSIGQHVRHCIEHYDELFVACKEARPVHYHARPRNMEVENDPKVAVNRLRFLCNQLHRIGDGNVSLEVSDGGIAEPSKSSLSRELEFLVSHTVHHFALITVLANKFCIEVPENFGIAPTTLEYRESGKS